MIISKPHKKIMEFLKKKGFKIEVKKVLGKWKTGQDIIVDIYLPVKKIIIEYDEEYYHRNHKQFSVDFRKTKMLIAKGYNVIRIRHKFHKRIQIKKLKTVKYVRTGNGVTK